MFMDFVSLPNAADFARPQYLAFLNSLLDDNGFVRLDSGEVVRRHRISGFLQL